MSMTASVTPSGDSQFSWIRTRLCVERTLMSWMRTATALIGFGFAIFQYLDRLDLAPGTKTPSRTGIYRSGAGCSGGVGPAVVDLAVSMDAPLPVERIVLIDSVLLIAIGAFAFFAVLVRLA